MFFIFVECFEKVKGKSLEVSSGNGYELRKLMKIASPESGDKL